MKPGALQDLIGHFFECEQAEYLSLSPHTQTQAINIHGPHVCAGPFGV